MIVLFSVISVIVLVFGSNFAMFNSQKIWAKRGEQTFAVMIAVVTWYLLFIYLFGTFLRNLSHSLAIFILITIFLLVLTRSYSTTRSYYSRTRKYSTKSIGILIILPFSITTFINLFLYTLTEFGSLYGYFYVILIAVIELAVVIVLISLRKRQWSNYAVSLLFLGTAIYGIMLEGEYFKDVMFYVGSFVALLVSLVFTTLFYTKFAHMSYSQFFKFGKNSFAARSLLVLVALLFIVGFYLIIPSSVVAPVYSYMNYVMMLLFGGAIFYFMNFQSSNKVTDAITFLIFGGVAVYGLHYLISIAPALVIGGSTPKYALWLALSLLIMYEPSYTLTNYITNNHIEQNFSITHLVERWRRRSKLLHSRYDISQKPFRQTGGTANIYQAYDVNSGKDVIIKIPVILCKNSDFRGETIPQGEMCPTCHTKLDTQDFKDAITILKDEIRALSSLDSPYIVKQLDHFDEGSPPKTYLVEEMVDGHSFTEVFENKPIGESKMLDLMKKALHGIIHAHTHGIIHRDLNTNNLMVTGSGDVKIIDFGTAKFKSRASQSIGRLSVGGQFGTEYFSPPESHYTDLIPNREPTFSYDIYSLGCIMYFMLTGDPPQALDATSASSIYAGKSYRKDFETNLGPRCSKPVLDIILKATSFSPEMRYQSAFEMICAIEHLSGEFLVTSTEQAFSLPASPNQHFSSEININFKKQPSSLGRPSFNSISNSLNLDLQSTFTIKQSTKYTLIYDPTLNQYKIIPGKSKLYYWYFDKDGKLVRKPALDTGIYLGMKIMLFSPTGNLDDVALAYYRVS